MIYLFTLLFIIVLAMYFDFGLVSNPRLKKICYYFLFAWLTAISAFAYNVGSDTAGYMREYAFISHHTFDSWDDFSLLENRQVGWMLLNIVCSRIYGKYVLLKFVIALFANFAVFHFIKKHTKYIFLAVLLYYICSYLNFNFNSIRQTMSLAVFLMGYDFLIEKKWIKYYICVAIAFMFHFTAILCALFPFLYLLKPTLKRIIIILCVLFGVVIYAMLHMGAESLADLFLQYGDYIELFTDRATIIEAYFGDNAIKYEGLNLFGMIFMIINTFPVVLVVIGGIRQVNLLPHITINILLLYLFLFFLDNIIPIVFMRLLMFIDVVFFCALSDCLIDYSRKHFYFWRVVSLVLLCFTIYRPVRMLFSENISSGRPLYIQFYPYYSVFDPQIDPVRAANFGCYREE